MCFYIQVTSGLQAASRLRNQPGRHPWKKRLKVIENVTFLFAEGGIG